MGGHRASAGATEAAEACAAIIPQETAGPYPGDGSNGPDVLQQSGIIRSDITSSFGEYTGTAEGVPLQIEFVLEHVDEGCVPYAGAAVYVWQCDRDGWYSLYSEQALNQNYLRGVQEADADGVVRFTSIFPACYTGRWPHIHFEVFPSLDAGLRRRQQQNHHLADRHPGGHLRGGVRHRGLRGQRRHLLAGDPGGGQRVR